jgi:hypothetical protein
MFVEFALQRAAVGATSVFWRTMTAGRFDQRLDTPYSADQRMDTARPHLRKRKSSTVTRF